MCLSIDFGKKAEKTFLVKKAEKRINLSRRTNGADGRPAAKRFIEKLHKNHSILQSTGSMP